MYISEMFENMSPRTEPSYLNMYAIHIILIIIDVFAYGDTTCEFTSK